VNRSPTYTLIIYQTLTDCLVLSGETCKDKALTLTLSQRERGHLLQSSSANFDSCPQSLALMQEK